MEILVISGTALLGAIVGSFLNVVVLRFGTGRSVVTGRSQCPCCGHTLAWFELVPGFSFLVQRGRCRACDSALSVQYPLVELLTAGVFGLIAALHFTGALTLAFVLQTLLSLVIFSILIVILVYDVRHKIIPDALVYTFAFLALATAVVDFDELAFVAPDPGVIAAGPLLFFPFFLLWYISRGVWMGLGDGKLALGIGWLLGPAEGVSVIVFAFWLGALVSLGLLALKRMLSRSSYTHARLSSLLRQLTMKSEVPFAPFLIVATLFVFAAEMTVLELTAALF